MIFTLPFGAMQGHLRPVFKLVQIKKSQPFLIELSYKSRRRPTLLRVCSTIGAIGLNFSVRNG